MRRLFIIVLFAGLVGAPLRAQQWSEDEVKDRLNLGLKLGLGMGSMYGGELKNPRPLMGFNAGLFFHGKDTNARLNWQTGLEARFRGSNFNNSDSGNTAYTKIGLITTDIPLLLNIRLGRLKPGFYKTLQVGATGSYILRSIVYIGEDKIPAQRENYLQTWKKLPLHPIDLQGIIGYQKRGPIAGWQVLFRMSLLNMNNNFYLPDNLPKTGTGKYIGAWNLDFAFLF